MNLQGIPVKVEGMSQHSIGNLQALLAEIAAQLERLVRDGQAGSIDLNSMPFAPGEYSELRLLLGEGDVAAHLEAIGPSEVVETRYPGVWWVTHYNVEGDIIADSIEITHIPEILRSQPADIEEGLASLHAELEKKVQP